MATRLMIGFVVMVTACAPMRTRDDQGVGFRGDQVKALLEADLGQLVGLSRDDFAGQREIQVLVEGPNCDRPADLFGKPVTDYKEPVAGAKPTEQCRVRFKLLDTADGRARVEVRKEAKNGKVAEAWLVKSDGTWRVAELIGTAIGT